MTREINFRFANATWGLLVVVVFLAGCSEGQPAATIKGSVKFNDRPVFPGTILAKQSDGQILSANLTAEGKFTLAGIEPKSYQIAIQTQKLANIGTRAPASAEKQVTRREDKIPDKFKNANVDIPASYHDWTTSNLTWDFTSEIPTSEVNIVLKGSH